MLSAQTMPSLQTNNRLLSMALTIKISLQRFGSSVADRRKAQSTGKSSPTSMNIILSKLLSLQYRWALLSNQVQLVGGLCPQEMGCYHLAVETPQCQVFEKDVQVWPLSSKLGGLCLGNRPPNWIHPLGRCHCQISEELSCCICSRVW